MNLGRHPDIFAASAEISFFNSPRRFARGGLDWYRAQFDGWSGESIVGEATPGYMMWQHDPAATAERIRQTVPDVRLLAVLRNPVDRAYSAMLHHIKRERLPRRSNLLALVREEAPEDDPFGLVAGGWYARSLEPYFERFGDQLMVVLHDDVGTEPESVYAQVLRHVGADPGFVPPRLGQVRFSNQASSEEDGARAPRPLTEEDRAAVFEYFESDVRELEKLIGRDLSAWYPSQREPAEATGSGVS